MVDSRDCHNNGLEVGDFVKVNTFDAKVRAKDGRLMFRNFYMFLRISLEILGQS